jgi:SAM-dependent methyltransferase
MHESVLTWGRACLEHIGAVDSALEIGACDVNGSLRALIDARSIVGIDRFDGPGVDKVMDGLDAPSLGTFDLVLMTEVLEHAEHWAALMLAAQACVAPGGHLLVTTRSPGYPWHGEMYRRAAGPTERWFIGDHWRFSVRMLARTFDVRWKVTAREDPDPDRPGVFVMAQRSRWPVPAFDAYAMPQP